jgi:hypothetical protein
LETISMLQVLCETYTDFELDPTYSNPTPKLEISLRPKYGIYIKLYCTRT